MNRFLVSFFLVLAINVWAAPMPGCVDDTNRLALKEGAASSASSPIEPSKSPSAEIRRVVDEYLPRAIAKKRRVGVELEFGGFTDPFIKPEDAAGRGTIHDFFNAMAKKLGGTFEGGMMRMVDAEPVEITKGRHFGPDEAYELRKAPNGVQLFKDGTFLRRFSNDSQAKNYVKKNIDPKVDWADVSEATSFHMKMELNGKEIVFPFIFWPKDKSISFGNDYIEGYTTEAEAAEWVKSWRGKETVLAPGSHIKTKFGDFEVKNESIAQRKEGFEVVSSPLFLEQRDLIYTLYGHVNEDPRARGTNHGWHTSMHTSVEGFPEEKIKQVSEDRRAQAARRLMLRWQEERTKVMDRFAPAPFRMYEPTQRNYFGPFPEAMYQELKALGDNPKQADIMALYEKHYPELKPHLWQKFADLNPLDILRGKTNRFEFRFPNSEFGGSDPAKPAQYNRDSVEFLTSFVEYAVSEPYP